MAHFVIQTDGERGVLLVDGEQPKLFGDLVGVNIRRLPLLDYHSLDSSPFGVHAREQAVVTVTLRLPIGPRDTLTVVQGNRIEDVQGPTADHVPDAPIEETGWWAEWDEQHREWHPTVQLPGSLMASFESWGFPSKADCLMFIRDHLGSLGCMHPTADDDQDMP